MNEPAIATKVKALRLSKHMSLEDVARKTGLHKGTISNIEKGRTQRVGIQNLTKLAEAFEVPVAELDASQVPPQTQNTLIDAIRTLNQDIQNLHGRVAELHRIYIQHEEDHYKHNKEIASDVRYLRYELERFMERLREGQPVSQEVERHPLEAAPLVESDYASIRERVSSNVNFEISSSGVSQTNEPSTPAENQDTPRQKP